jgi:hypothetical protein
MKLERLYFHFFIYLQVNFFHKYCPYVDNSVTCYRTEALNAIWVGKY